MSAVIAVNSRIESVIQIDGLGWLQLADPVQIVETCHADGVGESLRRVESLTRSHGYYAVGFVCYEAGQAFGLRVRGGECDVPLLWFALFDHASVRTVGDLARREPYRIGPLQPSIGRRAFNDAFERIHRNIADGDTYQVNYTWRLRGEFCGDPLTLFADLAAAQRSRYGAFVRTPRYTICSASPELFFSRQGTLVTARPMKGTTRRGRFAAEDRCCSERLQNSSKERAENVMVVDMVRNDLGRVAEIGSVDVPELFTLEPYPNVWQMTSTVTARTAAPLDEIFAAMFPCASVTGAPKHRTMQIIAALEREPRGVYTGAVGCVAPDGTARFNVAIRTAVLDEGAGVLEFGVGSGIVWDSDPEKEYEECLLKGSVLGRRPQSFELVETLRWTPGDGFFLLERHLERLRESAGYFGFTYARDRVRGTLDQAVASSDRARRVRLLLAADGTIRTEPSPLEPPAGVLRVGVAPSPIDPWDVFLFHKTTNRVLYERARSAPYDDVILWNPQREITESTIANVVVEIDGQRVTPPLECGLLPGTFRAALLASGEIIEQRVTLDQLLAARRLWLINSVRGWCPAIASV